MNSYSYISVRNMLSNFVNKQLSKHVPCIHISMFACIVLHLNRRHFEQGKGLWIFNYSLLKDKTKPILIPSKRLLKKH